MSGQLTEGFRRIVDMRWSEFVEIEHSLDSNNFDSAIAAIIRACKKGNLRAIQMGLDRLDGKIAAELDIELPKFYYIYPNATKVVDEASIVDLEELEKVEIPESVTISSTPAGPADMDEQMSAEVELPSGQLRPVLEKMLHSPRSIVKDILDSADAVDKHDYSVGDPMVKSVIVAGLMKLVHDGRISAVFEVFDQIDGKVADKLKVLGNDVYMKRYDLIAPAGAVKNEEGVYQLEAETTTSLWVNKLDQGKGRNGR